jgi:hypothetical protein
MMLKDLLTFFQTLLTKWKKYTTITIVILFYRTLFDKKVVNYLNKRKKIIVILIMLLVFCFFIYYYYFNVSGSKISQFLLNDDIREIQITKTYDTSEKIDVINKITLNNRQVEMLITLFNNSKFKRISSNFVSFSDKERYLITAFNADKNVFLNIKSYGGEFIIVDWSPGNTPAKHWKFRIRNDEWENILNKIISQSEK